MEDDLDVSGRPGWIAAPTIYLASGRVLVSMIRRVAEIGSAPFAVSIEKYFKVLGAQWRRDLSPTGRRRSVSHQTAQRSSAAPFSSGAWKQTLSALVMLDDIACNVEGAGGSKAVPYRRLSQ